MRRIHCFSFQCHDVNQIKRLYFLCTVFTLSIKTNKLEGVRFHFYMNTNKLSIDDL